MLLRYNRKDKKKKKKKVLKFDLPTPAGPAPVLRWKMWVAPRIKLEQTAELLVVASPQGTSNLT